MTKKKIWRLKEQPTAESLRELVKDNILTKDEARAILFSEEEQIDRDKKSLEDEIKFLRGLVEQLSKRDNTRIIETIKEIEKPWRRFDWYRPYYGWCDTSGSTLKLKGNFTGGDGISKLEMKAQNHLNTSFKNLKTF